MGESELTEEATPSGTGWACPGNSTVNGIRIGARKDTPMRITGRINLRSHLDRILTRIDKLSPDEIVISEYPEYLSSPENHSEVILDMVKDRLKIAEEKREHHKTTPFHEFPQTCGGCHWWSGYIGALRDILSGQSPVKKSISQSKSPTQSGTVEYSEVNKS